MKKLAWLCGLVAGALLTSLGCGGDDDGMMMMGPRDAGPPPPPPATAAQQVAFEGQHTLVTSITVREANLASATLVPETADSPIVVVEQLCNNVRCGAVL